MLPRALYVVGSVQQMLLGGGWAVKLLGIRADGSGK